MLDLGQVHLGKRLPRICLCMENMQLLIAKGERGGGYRKATIAISRTPMTGASDRCAASARWCLNGAGIEIFSESDDPVRLHECQARPPAAYQRARSESTFVAQHRRAGRLSRPHA